MLGNKPITIFEACTPNNTFNPPLQLNEGGEVIVKHKTNALKIELATPTYNLLTNTEFFTKCQ
jgi:hypothetical protein